MSMMQRSPVTIDEALTEDARQYWPHGMIARDALPVVPVKNERDDFFAFRRGADGDAGFRLLRHPDGRLTHRADGARAVEMADDGQVKERHRLGGEALLGAQLLHYVAEEYAIEFRVTDAEGSEAEVQSKLHRALDLISLDWEIRTALVYSDASNYSPGHVCTFSGSTCWDSPEMRAWLEHASRYITGLSEQSSDVVMGWREAWESTLKYDHRIGGPIYKAVEAIRLTTGGLLANTIIIPHKVERALCGNVPGLSLPDVFFNLKVLRPTSVYAEADGQMRAVWGNNVYIAYINPAPTLDALTFGSTFQVRAPKVKRWRDDDAKTTYYRASIVQTEHLVAPDCGYLLRNVIG